MECKPLRNYVLPGAEYGAEYKLVGCRVISRNLKLGGVGKCLGGVNMRHAQIYIENP